MVSVTSGSAACTSSRTWRHRSCCQAGSVRMYSSMRESVWYVLMPSLYHELILPTTLPRLRFASGMMQGRPRTHHANDAAASTLRVRHDAKKTPNSRDFCEISERASEEKIFRCARGKLEARHSGSKRSTRSIKKGSSMLHINFLAVVMAAVLAFAASAIWYIVFGKELAKVSPAFAEGLQKRQPWKMLAVIAQSLVIALVLEYFLGLIGTVDWVGAIGIGVLLWIGFSAMQWVGSIMWENVPFKM